MMAAFGKRLLSVKVTLGLSMALLAALLVHVSFTRADVTPIPCSSFGGGGASISYTGDETTACAFVEGGGTVQTKPPTTPDNPIWTKLIFPSDFTGEVSINEFEESPSSDGLSAQATCSFSTEYACLVSEVDTIPSTTEGHVWKFIFTVEEDTFPFETDKHGIREVHLYHDEVLIPKCDDGKLDSEQAICVLRKFVIDSGNEALDEDARWIVLTRTNGSWGPR
jgi:hypothetical protein